MYDATTTLDGVARDARHRGVDLALWDIQGQIGPACRRVAGGAKRDRIEA